MPSYNAIAELNISPTPARAADWRDYLTGFHPVVRRSARNGTEVTITLEATTIQQASRIAAMLLADTLGQIDRLEVLTTAEFDRRADDVVIPGLVGATEAAQILGVTRQRVQQMATAGTLPSEKVGNALVFARATVEAFAAGNQSS